jgi:hypothetical protein
MAHKDKVQPTYEGTMGRQGEGYSDKPKHAIPVNLPSSLDANEHGKSTDHFVKKGTPYGENAKFNHMPPGQDLFAQDVADLDRTNAMVRKDVTGSRGYDEGNA